MTIRGEPEGNMPCSGKSKKKPSIYQPADERREIDPVTTPEEPFFIIRPTHGGTQKKGSQPVECKQE